MRPAFAAALSAAGLLLVLPVTPSFAASGVSAGCAPAGAKVLEASGNVRVYSVPVRDPSFPGREGSRVVACWGTNGKRVFIASNDPTPRGIEGDFVGPIRIRSHFVAVGVHTNTGSFPFGPVRAVRIDLAVGSYASWWACRSPCKATSRGMTDLVVNAKGQMAWILQTANPPDPNPGYVVGRTDSRGLAVIDIASDVERRSLALKGTTIYWIAHGGPQDSDLY